MAQPIHHVDLFNSLSLLQKKSLIESSTPTILQSSLVLHDLLLNLLNCSEFLSIARLRKMFHPKKIMLKSCHFISKQLCYLSIAHSRMRNPHIITLIFFSSISSFWEVGSGWGVKILRKIGSFTIMGAHSHLQYYFCFLKTHFQHFQPFGSRQTPSFTG